MLEIKGSGFRVQGSFKVSGFRCQVSADRASDKLTASVRLRVARNLMLDAGCSMLKVQGSKLSYECIRLEVRGCRTM